MINNNPSRSPSPSSQMLYESGPSSDFSLDSASSDAQNAETVDRGELAWSRFQPGQSESTNQLFIAAEAGVFKARLGLMHELCRPTTHSEKPNENSFLNALLWGKKAINSFQAMNKTKHILAISDPDCRPDSQGLKSIFMNNLRIADSQTETNHRLGTLFANYNKAMPDQEIQAKVEVLESRLNTAALNEQELTSAFTEMQYLSNIYIAKQMPDKAVAIYGRLLTLLPTSTPPWQTSNR